jgi:hypothetical protein
MKKAILVLSVVVMGCGVPDKQPSLVKGNSPDKANLRAVEIDDCQYIIYQDSYYKDAVSMVHKGNCNNPIHKSK